MNQPEVPNSRLFILGGKGANEEEFREVFGKFGEIKDVWILKDRRTNEDKGVVYITYTKASMAALAQEEMNSQPMPSQSKPLKVLIANNRREGSIREPREEEKNQRIFIKVPKAMSERDLEDKFRDYGDIEYVNILRDKGSGEPKGLAYIKYHRAYHAALALENCDQTFKPIFAARKVSRVEPMQMELELGPAPGFHGDRDMRMDMAGQDRCGGVGPLQMISSYAHDGETRLEVMASTLVTQEQLFRLFDLFPGLEFCDLDVHSGVAYVRYNNPQSAAYARDKLNGFEYPPSYRLSVRYARHREAAPPPREREYGRSRSPHNDREGFSTASELNQSVANFIQSPNIQDNIQSLVESIKKATTVLQSAGVGPAVGMSPPQAGLGSSGSSNGEVRVRYCSTPLPEKQAMMSREMPVSERLFIVSQPDAFSEQVLVDCFCRFGNLIDAYFMPGRNYGYAKFGCKDSAKRAVSSMHGQSVCGQRLKVMLADPPKYSSTEEYESSSKRPRS